MDAAVEAMREAHASGQCSAGRLQPGRRAPRGAWADSVDALLLPRDAAYLAKRSGEPEDLDRDLARRGRGGELSTAFQRALSLNPVATRRRASGSVTCIARRVPQRRRRGAPRTIPRDAIRARARGLPARGRRSIPGSSRGAVTRSGSFLERHGRPRGRRSSAYQAPPRRRRRSVPETGSRLLHGLWASFLAGPADRAGRSGRPVRARPGCSVRTTPRSRQELALVPRRASGCVTTSKQEFMLAQTALEELRSGMCSRTRRTSPRPQPAVGDARISLHSIRRRLSDAARHSVLPSVARGHKRAQYL